MTKQPKELTSSNPNTPINQIKMDQIAFHIADITQAIEIKKFFGLENATWVEDIAEGDGIFKPRPDYQITSKIVAQLMFNYDLGIELELLTYLEGHHHFLQHPWWNEKKPFFSHIGIHIDEFPELPESFGPSLELKTYSHTNPYLIKKKRTYHYKIYNVMGIPMKYIKRIEHASE